MQLLDRDGLRAKGIKFTKQHINRLIKKGRFPRPIKVGLNTNAWIESEIDNYLADRVIQRDQAIAA
jgi:prophage regulatory protein